MLEFLLHYEKQKSQHWLWAAMWVLEANPGPLEEQPVLLTTEPSLQLWIMNFLKMW